MIRVLLAIADAIQWVVEVHWRLLEELQMLVLMDWEHWRKEPEPPRSKHGIISNPQDLMSEMIYNVNPANAPFRPGQAIWGQLDTNNQTLNGVPIEQFYDESEMAYQLDMRRQELACEQATFSQDPLRGQRQRDPYAGAGGGLAASTPGAALGGDPRRYANLSAGGAGGGSLL